MQPPRNIDINRPIRISVDGRDSYLQVDAGGFNLTDDGIECVGSDTSMFVHWKYIQWVEQSSAVDAAFGKRTDAKAHVVFNQSPGIERNAADGDDGMGALGRDNPFAHVDAKLFRQCVSNGMIIKDMDGWRIRLSNQRIGSTDEQAMGVIRSNPALQVYLTQALGSLRAMPAAPTQSDGSAADRSDADPWGKIDEDTGIMRPAPVVDRRVNNEGMLDSLDDGMSYSPDMLLSYDGKKNADNADMHSDSGMMRPSAAVAGDDGSGFPLSSGEPTITEPSDDDGMVSDASDVGIVGVSPSFATVSEPSVDVPVDGNADNLRALSDDANDDGMVVPPDESMKEGNEPIPDNGMRNVSFGMETPMMPDDAPLSGSGSGMLSSIPDQPEPSERQVVSEAVSEQSQPSQGTIRHHMTDYEVDDNTTGNADTRDADGYDWVVLMVVLGYAGSIVSRWRTRAEAEQDATDRAERNNVRSNMIQMNYMVFRAKGRHLIDRKYIPRDRNGMPLKGYNEYGEYVAGMPGYADD